MAMEMQKEEIAKFATIRDLFERSKNEIAKVLPQHLPIDRLIKVVLAAAGRDSKLLACNAQSLLRTVMQAAQLGLEPGGTLGHAHLVPFFNKWTNSTDVQLIIGYKGMLDLVRRSGQVESIETRVVYARDALKIEYGLAPRLEHIPCLDGDPGPFRAVYAVARLKGMAIPCFEFMPKSEVDAIRACSKSGNDPRGPWANWYSEMARKSVLKRLCKSLPVSIDVATALEIDADVDEDREVQGIVIQVPADEQPRPQMPSSTADSGGTAQLPAASPQVFRHEVTQEQPPAKGVKLPALIQKVTEAGSMRELNGIATEAKSIGLTEDEARTFNLALKAQQAEVRAAAAKKGKPEQPAPPAPAPAPTPAPAAPAMRAPYAGPGVYQETWVEYLHTTPEPEEIRQHIQAMGSHLSLSDLGARMTSAEVALVTQGWREEDAAAFLRESRVA